MTGRPGGLVLDQRCAVHAPPETVFAALTQPALLRKWWGPHGFTTPAVEVGLRVGGRYRFRMQPPEGEAFHLSGEYLEVDPPRRLVFSFRWEEPDPDDRETVAELSLEAVGQDTELSLVQGGFATEARLELHRAGWTDSFEKLRDLLDPARG
jgi:uncharacterized protein YndB with AHSA1/START domain